MAAVLPMVNENQSSHKGAARRGLFGRRNRQAADPATPVNGNAFFDRIDPATTREQPRVELVEHYTATELNPMPVLSAIGEDAARGTGGKISPQAASQLLHKHLAALDWRLAQARRAAVNQADAEADAANLTAADEAAQRVGGRVVVDSRAFVDKILKRADMRSNPEMHTQTFVAVSAATEFPAPMNGAGHPTVGEQLPARKMGEGDFLLDVDDTGTLDPLSMWRLVEKVERLDGRVVAVFVDGRSLGFAPDEVVWLLPPLEGRRQRDAAGNGRMPPRLAVAEQPSPVHAAEEAAPLPDEPDPEPDPLPQRHAPVTAFPAAMDEQDPERPEHGGLVPACDLLRDYGGVWFLDGDDTWSLISDVAANENESRVTIKLAKGLTIRPQSGREVWVLCATDAKRLLAEYEAQPGGTA